MSNETKKTALPKLRFPEFRGRNDWEENKLGEVSEIVRGGSPRPIEDFITTDPSGLNWLKIGDVASEAKYIFKTQQKVIREALSKTREVIPGDLILSNSMSFGRPYIMKTNSCIHDGWIAIRQIADEVLTDYLYYSISSEASQTYFVSNAAGAAVLNLNAERIKLLPLVIPSIEEQQKIAATLSSLDDLITAQNVKLAALQAHKRGLMQGLFPAEGETVPKLRFPEFQDVEEWEEKKLGSVLEFVMGNAFRSDEFTEDGIQLIRLGNLYQSELQLNRAPVFLPTSFKNKYSSFLVNPSDLLMSMTGTLGKRDYGFVVQVPEECSDLFLNQRVLKITPKNNYIKKFVLHQLKHEVFLEKLYSIPGGTKQANLSIKHLSEIKILFPQIAEQQKIADCLSSLDSNITAQSQKIEALKLLKKGLMQSLFPAAAEPTA